jgi:hypothetical protein
MANKNREDSSGIFVPAGLILGLGFGFLFEETVAGLFIGLGAGLLALALLKNNKK